MAEDAHEELHNGGGGSGEEAGSGDEEAGSGDEEAASSNEEAASSDEEAYYDPFDPFDSDSFYESNERFF